MKNKNEVVEDAQTSFQSTNADVLDTKSKPFLNNLSGGEHNGF